ncbi:MAG: hypothetical protein HY779_05060 [Rubrobacteridae bacterium]|nr:hypothetical protein [Rubrobacteridae bacterium]
MRKRLSLLNLAFVLMIIIGSIATTGCESKSSLFKDKIAKALEKADTISVYGISNDQSGSHEVLRKTMLRDSADFSAAVEALTNATSNGTISTVPFETVVYISFEGKNLLRLNYCVVDGRLSETSDEKNGILIIPWEFRSNIRTNR